MLAVGVLGCVAIPAYLGFHAVAGFGFGFVYPPPPKTLVMWDNLTILALSMACIGLTRTRFGPRWGRLIVASAFFVASIGIVLDDVAVQEVSSTAGYLCVLLLLAVAVMPYHLWHALVFGLAMVGVYFAGIWYLPAVLGEEAIGPGVGQSYFMIIVLILCTSISALLYNSRYEQYQARRKAEQLKEWLEKAYRSLEASLQRLTETQDQLIHSEKMASLGQLAAGIAHEMRNPLNFVNNFAELSIELADELHGEIEANKDRKLADVADDLEEILADLKMNAARINEHGQRANGIIRSMLEHARTQPGERRATDINALLEQYLALAYHGMRAGQPDFTVELEHDYDEAVGKVEVVPQEISRVFVNLLNNAFDAVHESAVRINGPYVPTVRVSTRQLTGQVEIRVSDNGPGIPPEIREKIFEPFFTTKPTGSGTGLGLSLSYEIVVQGHQGQMTVESEGGEGATFIITLPA